MKRYSLLLLFCYWHPSITACNIDDNLPLCSLTQAMTTNRLMGIMTIKKDL